MSTTKENTMNSHPEVQPVRRQAVDIKVGDRIALSDYVDTVTAVRITDGRVVIETKFGQRTAVPAAPIMVLP